MKVNYGPGWMRVDEGEFRPWVDEGGCVSILVLGGAEWMRVNSGPGWSRVDEGELRQWVDESG